MMRKGELLWMTRDAVVNKLAVEAHGHLWAFEGLDYGGALHGELWKVKSVATGEEKVFYACRFERVKDA
jgi:hypothetical protein